MKTTLVDRLTFVLWILNIIVIVVGFPLLLTLWTKRIISFETFNDLFQIIWVPLIILWIYTMYFFFKYDRYSPFIIFLLAFNVLYSPFYYYRVKIRKRQLRNKIDREKAESVFDKLVVEEEIDLEEEKPTTTNN